jgi:hypothetical protein
MKKSLVGTETRGYPSKEITTMRNWRSSGAPLPDRAHDLRAELSRRIAFSIGSAEKRVTDVPGLLFTRRTGPTAPTSVTYEPSLAVGAQTSGPPANDFHFRRVAIPPDVA